MNNKIKAVTLIASIAFAVVGCSGDDGNDGAAGQNGAAGAAGATGTPGEQGADANTVRVSADRTTTLANDLRGLTYARVGANAGKIYASGHVGTTNSTRQAVVARFNADGSPDTTFGADHTGFVQLEATVDEANNDETSLGVAELQSGDVVVTVNAADAGGGQSVFMFRLLPDGTKKAGWGDLDNKVEVVFGWQNSQNSSYPDAPATFPSDTAYDLKVDRSVADDRVVVFGYGSAANGSGRRDNDRYVARLNISNTGAVADPSFNGGNAFTLNSAGTLSDAGRRGLIEADGKIVAAGYVGGLSVTINNVATSVGNHVVLFRLNTDGTLDQTFGGFSSSPDLVPAKPGVAVFNPLRADGGAAECYGIAKQEGTSSYVTTGYGGATTTTTGISTHGYLTTLAPDVMSFRVSSGAVTDVDKSWGIDGNLVIQSEGKGFPSNEDRGRNIVALPDDRVIEIGRFGGIPAAYVLTADGQLDTQVNGDGIIELSGSTVDSQFFAAALSQDGKRVAISTDNNVNGARLVVLKVSSN